MHEEHADLEADQKNDRRDVQILSESEPLIRQPLIPAPTPSLQPSLARPLRPKSADDINPVPLHPTVTKWLESSGPSTAAAVEHGQDGAGGSKPMQQRRGVVVDLRRMNQAQLAELARTHNARFNIGDPVGEVLDGIRERAQVTNPESVAYPDTIGGNPKWGRLARVFLHWYTWAC